MCADYALRVCMMHVSLMDLRRVGIGLLGLCLASIQTAPNEMTCTEIMWCETDDFFVTKYFLQQRRESAQKLDLLYFHVEDVRSFTILCVRRSRASFVRYLAREKGEGAQFEKIVTIDADCLLKIVLDKPDGTFI